jgi:thiamine biosynthesis protein ThiI
VSGTLAVAPDLLLVRYGELTLKGKNRRSFEETLARNVRSACEPISPVRVERRHGRMTVTPERRPEAVLRRLAEVFGITSISPAWRVEATPEAITRAARPVLERALEEHPGAGPVTFRVATTRSDKRFPLNSTQLDRHVAEGILDGLGRIRVQLKRPELTLGIDVRSEGAYLFASRLRGPGGLPVGTLGKVMCLISGGIDSPVAAWLAMKRGCEVRFVTFHSYPYVGEPARKKVVDLVRVLARYQPRSRLFVVPFTEAQLAIKGAGRESYRTVLYRRMMQRIASRLAAREGAQALVTGECLGQVASQTLENMTCIGEAARQPVLRPVVSYDKQEIVELARRIGTFELSSVQEPDCCTLFMPERPVLRGRIEVCREAEEGLDVDDLAQRAAAGAEVLDLAPEL